MNKSKLIGLVVTFFSLLAPVSAQDVPVPAQVSPTNLIPSIISLAQRRPMEVSVLVLVPLLLGYIVGWMKGRRYRRRHLF